MGTCFKCSCYSCTILLAVRGALYPACRDALLPRRSGIIVKREQAARAGPTPLSNDDAYWIQSCTILYLYLRDPLSSLSLRLHVPCCSSPNASATSRLIDIGNTLSLLCDTRLRLVQVLVVSATRNRQFRSRYHDPAERTAHSTSSNRRSRRSRTSIGTYSRDQYSSELTGHADVRDSVL